MTPFDFETSPLPVRPGLAQSFQQVWAWIAEPGCWWTGAERVVIAREARGAWDCALCRKRKDALSPSMVQGEHARTGSELPEVALDAVHRLVTDATRLSRSWLEKAAADGLSNEKYVELLGVTVLSYSIDRFHRALGLPQEPLPSPWPGEPSAYRPASARPDVAWVPMIPEADARGQEADLYDTGAPNVARAMSLVPDCVRQMKQLSSEMYIPLHQLTDVTSDPGRALDRAQIELVAGRVSAANECFY